MSLIINIIFENFCPSELPKGAFCHFPFRWINYRHSSKSTGKETGKMHFCALFNFWDYDGLTLSLESLAGRKQTIKHKLLYIRRHPYKKYFTALYQKFSSFTTFLFLIVCNLWALHLWNFFFVAGLHFFP